MAISLESFLFFLSAKVLNQEVLKRSIHMWKFSRLEQVERRNQAQRRKLDSHANSPKGRERFCSQKTMNLEVKDKLSRC